MKRLLFITILLFIIVVAVHLLYLKSLRATETYPADTWLLSSEPKIALIITAHDDDEVSMAGTMALLADHGWKIHMLTFVGEWRKEDNETRKKEMKKAAAAQKLSSLKIVDFPLRRSYAIKEPWMPVPYGSFDSIFRTDSLNLLIQQALDRYQPAVVFTLDDIMGGYGHPEHVVVSQTARAVAAAKNREGTAAVKKIYQAVFPPSMNEKITDNYPAYRAAKTMYGSKELPLPTVEIGISCVANRKMEAMRDFHSQKRNLKKFWPAYYMYPGSIYFRIFDKEYFRVIDLEHADN